MTSADQIVVLNVDDYEAGRYATSRVLRQAGYQVIEAASGEEALELATQQPDLVVLDINLPGLNGFEVCQRIKRDPRTASIPVLYLSAAYRATEHRVQGLEMGADGYLTQPVDPRELVATVNALLRTRHVREAVERSEERFRSLMTATSDIIWTTGADGILLPGQTDWIEFTGQTPEEYAGWGWLDAVHPDDRARSAEIWARALEERGAYQQEHRLRNRYGEYRYMLVRAVPVIEIDGTVREWVGAHTDITERKLAERALQERNERLQFLSDAASRLLMTGDPREYAEHLFGQLSSFLDLEVYLNYILDPSTGLLRLRSSRGVPAELAGRIQLLAVGDAVRGGVAVGGEAEVVENVMESSDPQLALVREMGVSAYICFPLLSRDQPIGTVSFGTMTRPRFTPDEISLMRTVCNQVAVAVERERLITELQERARALEEANLAKSDFLATMSHELRTPLNAMIGYTDLLLLGVPDPLPDPATAHVKRIRGAALHLSQLIEEVLTHARIEAGRDEMHWESAELPELIADIAALMEPLARQKGLDFQVDAADTPERFETDPRKLRQILLNLLGNAVKFTEEGRVSLQVRVTAGELLLVVSDTGIGIDPVYVDKIFEPFWQVDRSKTRVAGGTGLGLGVVRQLARRLGGDVRVRSEPGRGSEFTVSLPLTRVPHASATP